jgi:hypothetical protein
MVDILKHLVERAGIDIDCLLPLEWAHQHDEATSPGLGGQTDGRGMLRLSYDETDR